MNTISPNYLKLRGLANGQCWQRSPPRRLKWLGTHWICQLMFRLHKTHCRLWRLRFCRAYRTFWRLGLHRANWRLWSLRLCRSHRLGWLQGPAQDLLVQFLGKKTSTGMSKCIYFFKQLKVQVKNGCSVSFLTQETQTNKRPPPPGTKHFYCGSEKRNINMIGRNSWGRP